MALASNARLRRHTLKTLMCAALAAAGLAAGPAQAADDWPSKPIKIIVPYTPGGSTDIVTRIVMEKLGPRLNQTIVVENRPGPTAAWARPSPPRPSRTAIPSCPCCRPTSSISTCTS